MYLKIDKIAMVSLKKRIEDIEREEIIRALKDCNWVMAKAARGLGITERMIGYRMRKYGISKKRALEREDYQHYGNSHL